MGCQLCASKQTVQGNKEASIKHAEVQEKDLDSKKNIEKIAKTELENFSHQPTVITSDKDHCLVFKDKENTEKIMILSEGVIENSKITPEDLEKEGEKLAEIEEKLKSSEKIPEGDLGAVPINKDDLDYSSFDNIVLLIGDSGSGKSSFLNLVYNFLSNLRTLDSIQVSSPTEKWDLSSDLETSVKCSGYILSDSSSFTKEIQLVQLKNDKNSRKFLFIDTPGFCRTDEEADIKTTSLILSFISQLPRLDTVLYVHRATVTTFESSLKATLAEFNSVLQDFNSKVIAIYSFAGSKLDVKHDSLPFDRSLVQKKYHAINNLTFSQSRTDLQDKKKLKGNQGTYEQTLNKLHSLIDSL